MEVQSEIMTKCKNMESGASKLSIHQDLRYSSEVNSDNNEKTSSHDGEIVSAYIDINANVAILKMELDRTKLELERKCLECEKLEIMRNKVEAELEDLTVSLFEEANKMVYDAKMKQHKAEKKLAAAEGKIDALEIEVGALKALVITSTPSNPIAVSCPQNIKKHDASPIRMKLHKKQLVFEKEKDKPDSPKHKPKDFKISHANGSQTPVLHLQNKVNKLLFHELSSWHKEFLNMAESPNHTTSFCNCLSISGNKDKSCIPLSDCSVIKESAFLARVFNEDVSLCLSFSNEELSRAVSHCIHGNSLCVELTANGGSPSQFCALSETATECKHRIRLADSESWFTISQSTRNRITSVCDFFTYLRYIQQRIVKHNADQVYNRIMDHRLEMTFARLGYYREQL